MEAKSTSASTYAQIENKPRHINPKMDQELKNYKIEVESKFKES